MVIIPRQPAGELCPTTKRNFCFSLTAFDPLDSFILWYIVEVDANFTLRLFDGRLGQIRKGLRPPGRPSLIYERYSQSLAKILFVCAQVYRCGGQASVID